VPAPSTETEFCGALANDPTFKSLGGTGGTLTITRCSFSGNVGRIDASLSGVLNLAYSITYTYN
jgi:hypothetical protein